MVKICIYLTYLINNIYIVSTIIVLNNALMNIYNRMYIVMLMVSINVLHKIIKYIYKHNSFNTIISFPLISK